MTAFFNSYAQDPEDELLDSLLDDLFFNEDQFIDEIMESANYYNLLYSSITYNSNTYFAGRDIGIDQFSMIPQLSFYNSKGFNVNVTGIYYGEYEPHWDYTNLSLCYFNDIGKKKLFSYILGYSRYIFSDGWDTLTNSFDVILGIKNKKRNLGTKLAASYLFGNGNSFQLISKTYGNIRFLKKKKIGIKFRPQLNFIFAKETVETEQIHSGFNTSYVYNDVFGLLNTQINLPISLLSKSWDIEIGYTLNFPKALENEPDLNMTGFFSFSLGYLLDFSEMKR